MEPRHGRIVGLLMLMENWEPHTTLVNNKTFFVIILIRINALIKQASFKCLHLEWDHVDGM
jgi:hypothetical protein